MCDGTGSKNDDIVDSSDSVELDTSCFTINYLLHCQFCL